MTMDELKELDDDYSDFDEDENICEGCGRDINSYDGGDPCPLCCGNDYSPGTEECDCCQYYNECAGIDNNIPLS